MTNIERIARLSYLLHNFLNDPKERAAKEREIDHLRMAISRRRALGLVGIVLTVATFAGCATNPNY